MTGQMPHADEPVLRLEKITKSFGALTANDHISFSLHRGEVVALLGENGAGKTTLTNIMFGQYVADSGHIELFGKPMPAGRPRAALNAGMGMVHQHFTLAENLAVWENIVLGTRPLFSIGSGRAAARTRIQALAKRFCLNVNPDARVGALSVGECQRAEILKALYRDARILILDEPTAVLTPGETKDLFDTLREATGHGLSVLFISHKLHEVMTIADRVLVLRHGRLVAERKVAATNAGELARLMVGEPVTAPGIALRAPGPVILSLRDVSTRPRGNAPGLVRLSLDLRGGALVGLAGVSGNGQEALAGLVSGLMTPSSGAMQLDGAVLHSWSPARAVQAGIARIAEDRHGTGTIANFTLSENAILERYRESRFSRHGWMRWPQADAFAREVIAGYDIRCPGPHIQVRLLSGGNMQKLVLGRVLSRAPRVILAHQPTRGLDIGAVNDIHRRLLEARQQGAAILLISEDLEEIMHLSDIIHVICGGQLSPAFARGTMDSARLGRWMAGEGFDRQAAHAS